MFGPRYEGSNKRSRGEYSHSRPTVLQLEWSKKVVPASEPQKLKEAIEGCRP